jgi:hypothetical protein
VQSRLLDAKGFRDTYAQLLKDQALLRSAVRNRHKEDVRSNMKRCVELCRARDARRQRLQRLKRTLDHSRGFLGADPKNLLEFWDPANHQPITSHSIGDPPPSGSAADAPPRSVPTDTSPEVSRRILHSRNASISSIVRFGRARESSSGVTVHGGHALSEHHREPSNVSVSALARASSPGVAGNSDSDVSVGARAAVAVAGLEEAGVDGNSNGNGNEALKKEAPVPSPDHTGALCIYITLHSPYLLRSLASEACCVLAVV